MRKWRADAIVRSRSTYFLDVEGFRLQMIGTIDGPPRAEGTIVTVTIRGADYVLLPNDA